MNVNITMLAFYNAQSELIDMAMELRQSGRTKTADKVEHEAKAIGQKLVELEATMLHVERDAHAVQTGGQ